MSDFSVQANASSTKSRGLMVGSQWVPAAVVTDYLERYCRSKTRTNVDRALRAMLRERNLPASKRHRLWTYMCQEVGL